VRTILLCAFFCGPLFAGDLTAVIHDSSADTPLASTYQFADTPVASASSIVVRVSNTPGYRMQITTILVAADANSTSPDFNVTGVAINKTLAADGSSFEEVTVNFRPTSTGAKTALFQAVYQVEKNGCQLASTDTATQCASQTATLSTLEGNATPAQLVLTYPGPSGTAVLAPNSSSPLDFGNVSTSATSSIVFTLTNQSASALTTPAVSLQSEVYGSSAFQLDASALPATLAASASGSFTVTFAPGQTGVANATLLIGTSSFPLTGAGVVIVDIDALQISYVDKAGVRTLPQAATPISFGQVVSGSGSSNTLTFTVTNPTTSYNAVAVPNLTVTGTGFAFSGALSAPLSIPPGQSITFQIVFQPSSLGTYTGSLAIGARQFSLTGKSITSALPDPSIQLDVQPLTSQQQVHLSIQLASASTISSIGQLVMTFQPSVTDVIDDPAVVFTATNGRELQVNVDSGAQNATYNGQSSITFQTGTTAGTITFTLTFPNKAPVTQSFTIAPQTVQISSGTAVRQSPNLVITLTGYDNTYSAGKLSFTFHDVAGKTITSTPLTIDATSAFHQYFFANNEAGGAFSVQATFPVTGDVNQVGSVSVSITNTAGSGSTTKTFQ
jgi:hypothetical protein